MRLLFLAGNRFSEWKVSRNICDSHIGTFRSKTIVFISHETFILNHNPLPLIILYLLQCYFLILF